MIDARELRIGNLVSIGGANTVIESINQSDFLNNGLTYWVSTDLCEGEKMDKINPIPLTEEWLVKFGFELTVFNKDSGYKQYRIVRKRFDIMLSIECNCNSECFLENIGIDVLYVHQLQNLYFALTGQELTIKNN